MLLWCSVYKHRPQDAHCTEEQAPGAAVLRRFDDAAKLGMHDGHAVHGMWIIDQASEHGDVIRCHGESPLAIKVLHEAYLARITATN